MPSQQQIEANRANAQSSTGPVTAGGKAVSKMNALQHGLTAREETLFAANPLEQQKFNTLKEKLRKQFQPQGEAEERIFHRHAYLVFQSERIQFMEVLSQDWWLEDPSSDNLMRKMDNLSKLRTRTERSADRALDELRKLQSDRYAQAPVNESLQFTFGHKRPLPASLPMAAIRRRDLSTASPEVLASEALSVSLSELFGVDPSTVFGVLFKDGPTGRTHGRGPETRA